MNFKEHRLKWNNCQGCHLCKTRKHVVLARGSIPCDILLCGEAPGASEDVLGQPFYGPAGHLLDKIVERATKDRKVKFAFTNLVACIPLGDDGKKTGEPSQESIDACRERLIEFISLCSPKAIVCVGKLATELSGNEIQGIRWWSVITHPATILRAELSQQGLMVQNCVVTISDVISELGL